ncbi:Twin-arginine translocation pathway signal [Embleya sp. NPDC050154]|uniref:Twin-arginine translocation pathway signal n=1 Tax=Embleya sp. NPDC050154 TaxID=3363988 RepID=UPI00379A2A43
MPLSMAIRWHYRAVSLFPMPAVVTVVSPQARESGDHMAIDRTPNTRLRAVREDQWRQSRAEFALELQAKADEIGERQISVDARLIARWEDGETARPRPIYRRVLVALTGLSEVELGIGPKRPEVAADRPSLVPTVGPVDRRQFLALTCASSMPIATPGARGGRPIDPAIVDYFREQLDGHYRADVMLGPHNLIPTVVVQYQLIVRLLDEAMGDTRRKLLQVAAAYTGLTTWLYQDVGDLGQAAMWANHTLELAHRADDRQLVGHALTNKAMVAMDAGDGQATVELTASALRDSKQLCAKVRVQAMQQAAHGHALLGERARVDILLDGAARLMGRVDDDFPWGNACRRSCDYIEIQRATCYSRMHLGAEAIRLWDQVLTALPPTSRRDGGVFLARQASALADQGRLAETIDALTGAVQTAHETGSARLQREITATWSQLAPWQYDPTVRQAEQLVAELGSPAGRF